MKTRSQNVTRLKDRPDYRKLLNGAEQDEAVHIPKKRYNTLPPPREPSTVPKPAPAPEPPGPVIKDTSRYIDEILKELRGDTEEAAPAPRPVPVSAARAPPPPRIEPPQPQPQHQSPPQPQSLAPPTPQIYRQDSPESTPSPVNSTRTARDSKFPCTFQRYGCTSTFASKNEWKRHVAIQHVQLGIYRCDIGLCNPHNREGPPREGGYNDFNRKDLFTMHQRRMHAPWVGSGKTPTLQDKDDFEKSLEKVRQRCWQSRRKPPSRSMCGFCGRVFEDKPLPSTLIKPIGNGEDAMDIDEKQQLQDIKPPNTDREPDERDPTAWEERMEHVGKHLAKGDTSTRQEEEDQDLTKWALEMGLLKDCGDAGVWLQGCEPHDADDADATFRKRKKRIK